MVTLTIHAPGEDEPLHTMTMTDQQYAQLEKVIGERFNGLWERWIDALIDDLVRTVARRRKGPRR